MPPSGAAWSLPWILLSAHKFCFQWSLTLSNESHSYSAKGAPHRDLFAQSTSASATQRVWHLSQTYDVLRLVVCDALAHCSQQDLRHLLHRCSSCARAKPSSCSSSFASHQNMSMHHTHCTPLDLHATSSSQTVCACPTQSLPMHCAAQTLPASAAITLGCKASLMRTLWEHGG